MTIVPTLTTARTRCPVCGLPTSRYGPREGQTPHDRCTEHGAVVGVRRPIGTVVGYFR